MPSIHKNNKHTQNNSKRYSINGKEFDTYKVGTIANSCSTMHKIAEKEFILDDFSCEHLDIHTKALLDEWREFCKWIEELSYSGLIAGKTEED